MFGPASSASSIRCAVAASLVCQALFANSAAADRPDSIEFFENRIRPVLVQHCYECHSAGADEIGGSLMLDSSGAMMSGGDSGPAIAPGDVEASVLVSAIRYESSEMPPQGKLPERVIKDFEDWIAAGATDPRQGDAGATGHAKSEIDLDEGRQFWAFRPLRVDRPLPVDSDLGVGDLGVGGSGNNGSGNWIDDFLAERLSAQAIVPNGSAGPATRLRRLSFDLTGLPPSVDLQERWLSDPSPRNYRAIVDELLASPEFAQHWARHWMDVARYADSNGSDFNATFHEAWRYRDYLIRSFAADAPIDQMIRQQIAGDLLDASSDDERRDNIVATTFLMLGTKMLSERDKPKLELDVVDEQIDTVGRAFLGMTLGCARCHDHKFDPIPTEDYYALAGIFKSTVTLKGESQKYVSTWNRMPLPTSKQHRAAVAEHAASIKSLKSEIKRAEQAVDRAGQSHVGIVVDDAQATKTGSWKESTYTKTFVGKGYVHDDNRKDKVATITFSTKLPASGRYEVRVSFAPGSSRSSAVPVTIQTADGEKRVALDQRKTPIKPMWASLGTFAFDAASGATVTLSNEGTSGYVIADAVAFINPDNVDSPADSDQGELDQVELDRAIAAKKRLGELKKQLVALEAAAPDPLPLAMAPSDRPTDQIADSHVHIRGEVKNLGDVVPRGFLRVCSVGDASIASGPDQGNGSSGRRELADWLTDPDHPLVARVFVNRVWMHLMGEGIVRTVDNFGVRGERPSHPELLDAIASDFIRGGWHLKGLVRQIVMTDAYARSSDYVDPSAGVDPENRLLWRMNRRRIPAESVRDAMLVSAARLDRAPRVEPMRGVGVLVSNNNANSTAKIGGLTSPSRSIYLPLVRGYLSPMMQALDMADPDLLVGKRPTTNVPGQALVLINSPAINDWALATAGRVVEAGESFDQRIEFAYQTCLQRPSTSQDRQIAQAYFQRRPESVESWHQWIAAIFASTEFRMLD